MVLFLAYIYGSSDAFDYELVNDSECENKSVIEIESD